MKLSYVINNGMRKDIEELTDITGSRKALFDNAITLLQWALNKVEKGHIVGSLDPEKDNFVELEMPIFSKVRSTIFQ
jgi:hypothetical protein